MALVLEARNITTVAKISLIMACSLFVVEDVGRNSAQTSQRASALSA
jgi:hypothetical protein